MSQAFRTVASVYSNATPVEFEVVAAGVSGDLAYLVGYERGWASVAGAPAEQISLAYYTTLSPRGRRLDAGASTR